MNESYRTLAGRKDTALLGSSLSGLFSFYGAWSRPDLFGKAACLSSSFRWADRDLFRRVQSSPVPEPMPYLDSDATLDPTEKDANLGDGFSNDPLLAGRHQSYPDTPFTRLGVPTSTKSPSTRPSPRSTTTSATASTVRPSIADGSRMSPTRSPADAPFKPE